jgi:hypothetical protein
MQIIKGLSYLKEVSRILDISTMPFSSILDAILSETSISYVLRHLKEVSRIPFSSILDVVVSEMLIINVLGSLIYLGYLFSVS